MNYQEQINELNKEIDIIISKAINDGYRMSKAGDLVKDDKIPVLEVFCQHRTDEESYGKFVFSRGLLPLTSEQLKEILSKKPSDILDDDATNMFICEIEDLFFSNIKYYNLCSQLQEVNKYKWYEDEWLEDDRELFCVELESIYGIYHGYISLVMMTEDELEKEEEFDIYFKKFITFN